MVVAITSEGLDSSSLVAEKFGRAPFIIFYDTEKNTFESFRNPYANLFGGAGIQTSQLIIEKNSGAVITVDIGLDPLRLLKSADVKVYSCSAKQVIMVVNEFMEEKLLLAELGSNVNFGRKRHGKKGRNMDKNI